MLESGFVRIYRSMLKWEWYDDANTMRVFLHLILTANYEPQKWHGITIERGQRICSYGVLAKELKLSEKSVRTAIGHLMLTGEVAHAATPNYGVFTVLNYELYQQPADQAAPDGHPDSMNNLLTDENSEKNGHTNWQTTGTVQTQSASQKFVCQESEQAPEQSPDGHPTGTRAAPDGHQWKKDKESNKAKKAKEEGQGSMSGAEKSPPDRKVFISLILNDKTLYPVYEDQIPHWKELYPAVNVEQELRNMAGWCEGNPANRKTRGGIGRFISHWLQKTQDRGGNNGYGEKSSERKDDTLPWL